MQRTLKLFGRSWWVVNIQLNRSVIMEKFVLATRRFMRDEEGVTAIEYGLIAALIAVAIITGATAVGTQLDALNNHPPAKPGVFKW
jgi:pilus assembly protein Flp/PilA